MTMPDSVMIFIEVWSKYLTKLWLLAHLVVFNLRLKTNTFLDWLEQIDSFDAEGIWQEECSSKKHFETHQTQQHEKLDNDKQ